MKTDIEYLTLLETDLQQAATREKRMFASPQARLRRSSGARWGTFAAGLVGFLVVAGLIGLIATNGGLGGSSDRRQALFATPVDGGTGPVWR